MFTGNKDFMTQMGPFRGKYKEGVLYELEKLDHLEEESEGKKILLKEQMEEYFKGERTSFTVFVKLIGTEFERKVYMELLNIPYGETISYKELAKKVDCEEGSRAVGNALNKNPLPIVIPCHRVIGSDGDLKGYRFGLELKEKLLEIERNYKE